MYLTPGSRVGQGRRVLDAPSTWFGAINNLMTYSATTFGAGNYAGRLYVPDRDMLVAKVLFWATSAAATAVVTPAIYNTPDTSTNPLLMSGPSVTGVVANLNILPLYQPVQLLQGQACVIGIVGTTANISMAQLPSVQGSFVKAGSSPPANLSGASLNSFQGACFWLSN